MRNRPTPISYFIWKLNVLNIFLIEKIDGLHDGIEFDDYFLMVDSVFDYPHRIYK